MRIEARRPMPLFSNRRPALALLALLIASCGGPSPIPPAAVARAALETSLTAWRDGKPPSATAQAQPPVHSVDSQWSMGRKLASFEVLREQPSETDKRFVVKLNYRDPPAVAEGVYVVIASQPLAVFREEDFIRNMNMDNNPPASKKKK